MSWQCRMYAAQSTCAFITFLTCMCVYVMHLCVQNAQGHFRSNKRPDTMLSDRKRKFNFRCSCMNRIISMKRRRQSILLPFLSLLLTVFDYIRQVNEKQHGRNDWQVFVQPAPAKVYVGVRIPASAYVWLSRVLRHAIQSTRWWDSKRVMRSLSIPSGWGPFCRCKMVMK